MSRKDQNIYKLSIMKTLLLSALIFIPAVIGGQEAKASLYNPYESSYKQWNRDNGRHLESWNPYKLSLIHI